MDGLQSAPLLRCDCDHPPLSGHTTISTTMSVCSRQFAIDCPFPLLVTFWLADAKFSSPPSDQYPSCAAPGRSWTLLNALLAQEVRHIQDTATNAQHLLAPGIAGDPTIAPRAVEAPTAVDACQEYFRGESDRDMPDTH